MVKGKQWGICGGGAGFVALYEIVLVHGVAFVGDTVLGEGVFKGQGCGRCIDDLLEIITRGTQTVLDEEGKQGGDVGMLDLRILCAFALTVDPEGEGVDVDVDGHGEGLPAVNTLVGDDLVEKGRDKGEVGGMRMGGRLGQGRVVPQKAQLDALAGV